MDGFLGTHVRVQLPVDIAHFFVERGLHIKTGGDAEVNLAFPIGVDVEVNARTGGDFFVESPVRKTDTGIQYVTVGGIEVETCLNEGIEAVRAGLMVGAVNVLQGRCRQFVFLPVRFLSSHG